MNLRQRSRFTMFENVERTLEAYKEVWIENSNMLGLHEKLLNYRTSLSILFNEKAELSTPFASVKNKSWEDFAIIIAQLAGYVQQIATDNDLREVSLYSGFTHKSLTRGSVLNHLTTASNVIKMAEQLSDEVQKMDGGKELLESAKASLEDFQKNSLKPSERRRRLKEVNISIDSLIDEVQEFLKSQLDMIMRIYMATESQFFREYENSRKTVISSRSRASEDDLDMDSESSENAESLEEYLAKKEDLDMEDSSNLDSKDIESDEDDA